MFNKFRRYFNQNTWKIFVTAVVIVFVLFIIQVFNSYHKTQTNPGYAGNQIIGNNNTVLTNSMTNSNQIKEEEIGNKPIEITRQNILDMFVGYCNKGKIQEAYNLISQDCKDLLFPTVEIFKANYYNIIFTEQRTYSLEEWEKNTGIYRIRYQNNILVDGGIKGNQYEDYIKVISIEKEIKLNINSFIASQEINTEIERENIDIQVLKKDMYMNYETYTIKITNRSNSEIEFTNLEKNSINISDKNANKYGALTHELPLEYFKFKAGQEQTLTVKFNKVYNNNRNISKMNFESVLIKDRNQERTISMYVNI